MESFILWSTKNGGWMTPSSITSSEVKAAAVYTHKEMLDMCKLHARGKPGTLGLIPISVALLKEITG